MTSNPLLIKAERFIHSAEILEREGDYDSASSRLYYAMFYVAESLLEARGMVFSSHRAVISAFGQNFAKTKEIDPQFHQDLLNAFTQRQLGDYAPISNIRPAIVTDLRIRAIEFLKVGKQWLDLYDDNQ